MIHKASLNARRGHWQSNERPIILFDWPRRRTLFQSMRLKLGPRGTECESRGPCIKPLGRLARQLNGLPQHALLNPSAASPKKTGTRAVRLIGSVGVLAYEVARQNS